MPTLPTYQSREQLQQVQRPNIGKQYGVGDVLGSIGQEMTDRDAIAAKTKIVEESNRVDRANINTQIRIAELNTRYNGNEIAFQEGEYDEELAKIQDDESGQLTTMVGIEAYKLDTDLKFAAASIKASANRVTAVTTEARESTVALLGGMKDSPTKYIDGNDLIDRKVAIGAYSPEEGSALKQDTIMDWELYGANKGSEESAELNERLKNPHKDPVLSKLTSEQIEELGRDARAVHSRQTYGEKVAVESDKVQAERLSSAIITQDNMSGYQRYVDIKQLGLSKTNENRALAVLNKRLGIAPDTNSETVEALGLDLDYFKKGKNVEPDKYFKQIQDYRAKVDNAYIDGLLSPASYDQLLLNIDKATDLKQAEVAGQAVTESDWGDWGYEHSDAAASFKSEFDSRIASKLFADYFARKNEPDFDNTEDNRKELVQKIKDEETAQQRTTAQRIVQQFATRSSLKQERDKPTINDSSFLESINVTEQDIEDEMESSGETREQVIQYLRNNA